VGCADSEGRPKLQSRLRIDGCEVPRIRFEDQPLHDGSCQWRDHLGIEIRWGAARRYGHAGSQHQGDEHSTQQRATAVVAPTGVRISGFMDVRRLVVIPP
jgi:hypothetical protein